MNEFSCSAALPHGWPVFRRCIRLHVTDVEGGGGVCVRAALEDDFHHFRVELQTRGHVIEAIRAHALRYPYSLCPSAADSLQRLVGRSLPSRAHALGQWVDASEQCTHMLDLAGLASAAAARGAHERRYDVVVPLRRNGRTHAWLERDGVPLLHWAVVEFGITGPQRYAGRDLRHGFARWALENLSEEEAEAALVLRRCAVISMGKGKPLDRQIHAVATGRCYAQQPERAPLALRQVGSTWDFTARRDALCADDAAWLTGSV
ncbi:DUF2889 domain-containing protein [Caldimonas thermodepolymerans]|jgi:hypothetical protein|uniref:DUF2889 domain-containing protein n=1 Tax=Caldimonas thermodepolymerans TaxID=215580 RepID=UPI0022363344|nr:DUF2889 domain-containing protein [Caldimonas thermodepolymerans]UZG46063.1 DUF2889 domain-containing protein [Caldimonas thermodepolymerans]